MTNLPIDYYTAAEVATMLRQTKRDKIYTMCRSGELRAFLFGRTWLIEKEYFDSEEVRKANAMNDKTMAPPRRIRLATTDSNKYYAKAVFVADKENIITGELLYRPDF